MAERVRKLGARTIHSIGEIARLQTIKDNEKGFVTPADMLAELMSDNKLVIRRMRAAHEIADKHGDVATASILENFIDQAEKRNWFLFEASRRGGGSGH
jgi:starvation-inducible DNA-binding protein